MSRFKLHRAGGDMDDGNSKSPLPSTNIGEEVLSMATNQDFSLLGVASRSVFKVFRVSETSITEVQNLRSMPGTDQTYRAQHITWDPNSSHKLASASTIGCVVLWDINKSGHNKRELAVNQHNRAVTRVIYHPRDSAQLLSCANDGGIRLLDLRLRETAIVIKGGSTVRDIKWFNVNTNYFTVGTDNGTVEIYDVRMMTKDIVCRFPAHSGPVYSIDFHPDSYLMATGGRDRFVKIWEFPEYMSGSSLLPDLPPPDLIRYQRLFAPYVPTSSSFNLGAPPPYRGGQFRPPPPPYPASSPAMPFYPGKHYGPGYYGPEKPPALPSVLLQRDFLTQYSSLTSVAGVSIVKWRPERAYQIAASAMTPGFCCHVWDLRRSGIPFVGFQERLEPITGMIWKDRHHFLTSGKDGVVKLNSFSDGERPASNLHQMTVSCSALGYVNYTVSDQIRPKLSRNDWTLPRPLPRLPTASPIPRTPRRTEDFITNNTSHMWQTQSWIERMTAHGPEGGDAFCFLAENYRWKDDEKMSVVELFRYNAEIARLAGYKKAQDAFTLLAAMYNPKYTEESPSLSVQLAEEKRKHMAAAAAAAEGSLLSMAEREAHPSGDSSVTLIEPTTRGAVNHRVSTVSKTGYQGSGGSASETETEGDARKRPSGGDGAGAGGLMKGHSVDIPLDVKVGVPSEIMFGADVGVGGVQEVYESGAPPIWARDQEKLMFDNDDDELTLSHIPVRDPMEDYGHPREEIDVEALEDWIPDCIFDESLAPSYILEVRRQQKEAADANAAAQAARKDPVTPAPGVIPTPGTGFESDNASSDAAVAGPADDGAWSGATSFRTKVSSGGSKKTPEKQVAGGALGAVNGGEEDDDLEAYKEKLIADANNMVCDYKPPPLDFTEVVSKSMHEFVDMGDVQTAVVVLMILKDKLRHAIPEDMKHAWYSSYIDLHYRYKLFPEAAAIIKYCPLQSISERSRREATFKIACGSCGFVFPEENSSGEPVQILWCRRCKTNCGLCSYCHRPVTSHYVWCYDCCHGGHIECFRQWFGHHKQTQCCTGCGHLCNQGRWLRGAMPQRIIDRLSALGLLPKGFENEERDHRRQKKWMLEDSGGEEGGAEKEVMDVEDDDEEGNGVRERGDEMWQENEDRKTRRMDSRRKVQARRK